MNDHTAGPRTLNLSIDGMSCGHCVAAVKRALADTPGVEVHDVKIGSASVAVAPDVASPEAVVEAVRDAGYDARVV